MGRKPKPRTDPKPVPIEGCEWIPLTRGKWALVDLSDAATILAFNWHATEAGYAARWQDNQLVRMHEQLMGAKGVDHINRSTLDNRRSNLRLANGTQNQGNRPKNRSNRSGFKGVSKHAKTGLWRARLAGKTLGYFTSPEEAAKCYDAGARVYFGDFALLNFPEVA